MREHTEQKDVDYKEKFGDRVLKDLSAFANTGERTVVLGVSDDGKIKGIDLSNKELKNTCIL